MKKILVIDQPGWSRDLVIGTGDPIGRGTIQRMMESLDEPTPILRPKHYDFDPILGRRVRS